MSTTRYLTCSFRYKSTQNTPRGKNIKPKKNCQTGVREIPAHRTLVKLLRIKVDEKKNEFVVDVKTEDEIEDLWYSEKLELEDTNDEGETWKIETNKDDVCEINNSLDDELTVGKSVDEKRDESVVSMAVKEGKEALDDAWYHEKLEKLEQTGIFFNEKNEKETESREEEVERRSKVRVDDDDDEDIVGHQQNLIR